MRHLLVFVSIFLTIGQASAGTVWGTVTPGKPPPSAPKYRDACLWRLGSGLKPATGWGQMIVILEGKQANLFKSAKKPRTEIRLEGYEIQPPLIVVPVGSTVTFKNQSPQIYSCSAEGPNGFQFSDLKTGANHEQRLLSEGIVEIRCHQFPFMHARILVVSSPLHTEVGASGNFSFQKAPPGTYRGKIFARGKWRWTGEVKVPESGLTQVKLGPQVTKALPPPGEASPPEDKPPPEKPRVEPERQKPSKPPFKKPPPVKPREKPGMQKPPKPPPEKENAEDMDEPTFKDVEPEIEIEEE
jgi:hypothetical protein